MDAGRDRRDHALGRGYRGLWGLDTQDRFGGERAPAGPRFERAGTVRQSWIDPLGWAGLQKVPATGRRSRRGCSSAASPSSTPRSMRSTTRSPPAATTSACSQSSAASLERREGFAAAATAQQARIADHERELQGLVVARAETADELDAHRATLADPLPPVDPHAHLHHKVEPVGHAERERIRFLRVWSTISTPLLFAAAAWLIVDHSLGVLTGLIAFTVVFLTIEATARGRLLGFVLTVLATAAGLLIALGRRRGRPRALARPDRGRVRRDRRGDPRRQPAATSGGAEPVSERRRRRAAPTAAAARRSRR